MSGLYREDLFLNAKFIGKIADTKSCTLSYGEKTVLSSFFSVRYFLLDLSLLHGSQFYRPVTALPQGKGNVDILSHSTGPAAQGSVR